MVEIEFFLPDEPPEGAGQREEIGGVARPRRHIAFDHRRLTLVVLLAAAATLPVIASFQRVSTVRQSGAGPQLSSWVDGWGRFRSSGTTPIPTALHDPRFGLPLTACAGAFALLALAVTATFAPPLARRLSARVHAILAAAAVAVCGVLAGVLAAVALQVDAASDRLRATTFTDGSYPPGFRVDLQVGGCLWFGSAGLVAGVLAVIAGLHLRPTSTVLAS